MFSPTPRRAMASWLRNTLESSRTAEMPLGSQVERKGNVWWPEKLNLGHSAKEEAKRRLSVCVGIVDMYTSFRPTQTLK